MVNMDKISNILNQYNFDMDRYIGKITMIWIPRNKRQRYRWIVRKRQDGRYIVRTPKHRVLRKHLNLKRETDYGKETLLHIDAYIN
jgi:hypothetical protein